MKKYLALLALLGIAASAYPLRAADEPMSKSDVEGVVKDYLNDHPEVIMDALKKFQEKQRAEAATKATATLKSRKEDILTDKNTPIAGNAKGDVTVVEFFDYHCGYCKKMVPTVTQLLKDDPKLKFSFKELPILSPDSEVAARASIAFSRLAPKKYFEYHTALMGMSGKLKIFFGACAGVGKTYAMLSASQQALREGMNVVIGVVETHGREETVKLAEGIPTIPPKIINYRGAELQEFDIDTALSMKPPLILLDELAHTNVPGSRHPKRWQDVDEMLDAGIDVYTTLNVQHLESLNDVVARITGIWVKETVPDAFFDKADEISLVDIPSEELLKRLKEGKVYIAPGAKRRAAQNFFKKSNLIALRELALRRTAERVDQLMETYKGRGGQAWSGADKILVCIGPDALSGKLVRVAKRTANGLRAPWTAAYVENERHYALSPEGQEAVDRTLRLAERMGAKTSVIQGGRAHEEIVRYARDNGFTKIIVGKIKKARWKEVLYGTLADNIMRLSGDIDVYVVTGEAESGKGLRSPFWHSGAPVYYYLAAPVVAFVFTLILFPLRPYTIPANLVMPYLVGIVLVAVQYGRGPALLATLCSAIMFNMVFIPPYFSLKFSEENHIVTFAVLLLTGVLIGTLTARLRLQAIHARRREETTSTLYDMTRELTGNRGKETLAEIAARHIADVMDCDVSVWIPDQRGQLSRVVEEGGAVADADPLREESAAQWAYTHKQNAGLGTETLPSARGLYLPLVASSGVVGVIGVAPEDGKKAIPSDSAEQLETFASIMASALERATVAELVEKTMLETEGEKLRNILLSSVSHDLRMPLASITGAASTLLLEGQKITDEYRMELLRLIHEEAARLARMVTNLLDVTSLESGSVKLNKELYFIEELIGSALMRTEHKMGARQVVTRIEPGLPLVRMDGLLIEQVLINLLENIAGHTPQHTRVTITAKMVKPDIHVIVQDDGPGVPPGDEERIFDKFYHTPGEPPKEDLVRAGGMGLAISRGIITAHGGKIWAQNGPQGGAMFTFTLPIKTQGE